MREIVPAARAMERKIIRALRLELLLMTEWVACTLLSSEGWWAEGTDMLYHSRRKSLPTTKVIDTGMRCQLLAENKQDDKPSGALVLVLKVFIIDKSKIGRSVKSRSLPHGSSIVAFHAVGCFSTMNCEQNYGCNSFVGVSIPLVTTVFTTV